MRKGGAAGLLGVLVLAMAVGAATLAASYDARAQSGAARSDIQALINRIDRLQREMNTLQRQVYRGDPAAPLPGPTTTGGSVEPNLVAAMQVRLDEIESQMRGFTGRMEELQHAVSVVKKRLEKLSSDIDFRLKALESRPVAAGQAAGVPPQGVAVPTPGAHPPVAAPKLHAAPSQPGVLGTLPLSALGRSGGAKQQATPRVTPPAKKPAKAAPALPKGTPEAQYKHASDLLFRSDFGGAEKAFSAFVAAHPTHRLAGNAQYWLGESHYARGAFRTAAAIFAEGYQKYPNSSKAPDNLLKLGMSLAAIDKRKSACKTFKRLLKEFPKASRTVRSRARAQHKKLRCR